MLQCQPKNAYWQSGVNQLPRSPERQSRWRWEKGKGVRAARLKPCPDTPAGAKAQLLFCRLRRHKWLLHPGGHRDSLILTTELCGWANAIPTMFMKCVACGTADSRCNRNEKGSDRRRNSLNQHLCNWLHRDLSTPSSHTLRLRSRRQRGNAFVRHG
jgi:hypothetical protein